MSASTKTVDIERFSPTEKALKNVYQELRTLRLCVA